MSTQPILAFDCVAMGGSVALMANGHITTRLIGQTAQAAELVPAIDAVLREANVAYADIAAIVSTLGPGSFTGVRIGLATLHGLVLVHQTPMKMLTTLEAFAWAVAQKTNPTPLFWVALRAGKGELYAQKFSLHADRVSAINEIRLLPETYREWDAPCFGNHLTAEDAQYIARPDTAILCTIAQHLPITPLEQALPLYIRAPDAIAPMAHPWLTAN